MSSHGNKKNIKREVGNHIEAEDAGDLKKPGEKIWAQRNYGCGNCGGVEIRNRNAENLSFLKKKIILDL